MLLDFLAGTAQGGRPRYVTFDADAFVRDQQYPECALEPLDRGAEQFLEYAPVVGRAVELTGDVE